MALRQWNVETEIRLLSLVCEFKPAGPSKQQNLDHILQDLNESTDDKFTQDDIEKKLDTLYNMANVEKIEADNRSDMLDEESKEPPESEATKKPEEAEDTEGHKAKPKAKTFDRKISRRSERLSISNRRGKTSIETTSATDNSDAYSSELSDVEGEEAVFAKLNDKDIISELAETKKNATRPQTRKQDRNNASDSKEKTTTNDSQKPKINASEETEQKESEEEPQDVDENTTPEPEERTRAAKASVDHVEPPLTRKRTRANAKLDSIEPPKKKPAKAPVKKNAKKEPSPEVSEPPKAETPVVEQEPKKRRSVRQTARRSLRK